MERYTEEFKQMVEDSSIALMISLPELLSEKATVTLKNKKDHAEFKLRGNRMTQLFLLASASAELIKDLEADKEEDEEDIDLLALFLSAFELETVRKREQKNRR